MTKHERPTELLIRPRPGIILPGLPAKGALVPYDLAREWLDSGLAVEVKQPAPPAKEE